MIERIKGLCREKGISIHVLEMELGFANASIYTAKAEKIGAARVKAIADYFNVSMEYILTGEETSVDFKNGVEDAMLLKKIHSLSPEKREMFDMFMSALLQQ